MPADMTPLLDDLRAEHADLDALVAGADLSAGTPADGWTVADTVGHLWFFDREATKAIVAPDEFASSVQDLLADVDAYMAAALDAPRQLGDRLPEVWRGTRTELLQALAGVPAGTKVPWYGPPMSPASFATARLMEYWAHGQDVADALGVRRTPTARLRHICHLGVRTRGFSYAVRGQTAPDAEVHVALKGPDGDVWTWGDDGAPDRVEGSALDFCLVVTQRRLLDDTALTVTGAAAREWLGIAQAFAGMPTVTPESRRGLSA